MACQELIRTLSVYLERKADREWMQQVAWHLKGCSDCRVLVQIAGTSAAPGDSLLKAA